MTNNSSLAQRDFLTPLLRRARRTARCILVPLLLYCCEVSRGRWRTGYPPVSGGSICNAEKKHLPHEQPSTSDLHKGQCSKGRGDNSGALCIRYNLRAHRWTVNTDQAAHVSGLVCLGFDGGNVLCELHPNVSHKYSNVIFLCLTLDATSWSSGTTAVWTKFPFTTNRISMESVVKARM